MDYVYNSTYNRIIFISQRMNKAYVKQHHIFIYLIL